MKKTKSDLSTNVVKTQNRILYPDLLRLISIVAVIVIHSCTLYLYDNNINLKVWASALFIDNMGRWCIGVFFMVSGMFLLNPAKEEPLSVFFKKRFLNVLIPFITWSLIYAKHLADTTGNVMGPVELIKSIIQWPIFYHLWFVYTLLGLYLITPVIRVFVKHATAVQMKYFLIMWFVLAGLNSVLKYQYNINVGFDLTIFTGYVGFFVLGYYLSVTEISKEILHIIYSLGVLGLVVTFVGNYLLNYQNHFTSVQTFYTYLTPSIMITSVSVFLLFKNLDYKFNYVGLVKRAGSIRNLSKIVFGVYLLHPLVLDFLKSRAVDFDFLGNANLNVSVILITASILLIFCFTVFFIADFLKRRFKIFGFLSLFY